MYEVVVTAVYDNVCAIVPTCGSSANPYGIFLNGSVAQEKTRFVFFGTFAYAVKVDALFIIGKLSPLGNKLLSLT